MKVRQTTILDSSGGYMNVFFYEITYKRITYLSEASYAEYFILGDPINFEGERLPKKIRLRVNKFLCEMEKAKEIERLASEFVKRDIAQTKAMKEASSDKVLTTEFEITVNGEFGWSLLRLFGFQAGGN